MSERVLDPTPAGESTLARQLRSALSVQKISGIYVLIFMIIMFSIWVPETFPQWDTARQILNNNAIGAMAALALIIPLSAGVFDISVSFVMTMSGVFCAYTIVNTGLPLGVAILIAMLAALAVGLFNGMIIVVFRIESLIGTLATGFLITSVVSWRTGNRVITSDELAGGFSRIAREQFLGLTLPVWYALAYALVLWYVLEHTATGRRIYATGFNTDATRLAGIRTNRIQFGSLITSSLLAGFAGIALASQLGSGLSTAGNPFLIGAFAAVFLGATQLKNGRFNSWGTIIGVILLGTGTTGLGLANQPQWVQNQFRGWVLIASLALTGLQIRTAGASSPMRSLLRRWFRLRRPDEEDSSAVAPSPTTK